MKRFEGIIYQIQKNTQYVVEQTHILLLNEKKQYILAYPEAAIWDFLIKQYPLKKMTKLLSSIAFITESHAEHLIKVCLKKLCQEGFIIKIL